MQASSTHFFHRIRDRFVRRPEPLQARNPYAGSRPGPAVLAFIAAALIATPSLNAQSSAVPSAVPGAAGSLLQTDPRTWAEQCAAKEAAVIVHPNSFLRYRMHVIDERGDQLRDQIETPDGSVARLVMREGRPLTPDEDAAERDRLNYLLANPAAFARHIRNEQSNKKMGVDLLNLMPRAMLWSYAPGQPALPDAALGAGIKPAAAGSLVVLDFAPDPKWNPPGMTAEALTGLAGRVWIDPATQQMVYVDGSLIKPVNIGWGMVAHLYPGARISLHQVRATPERWIVDHIVEQLNVRALMFKTIRQRLVYDTSNYQTVPSMTYQQAIKLLLDTPPGAH